MSLQSEFQTALAAASGMPQAVHADDGGLHLVCEIEQLDALAVTLQKLALATGKLAGATVAQLQQISDELASRVTYLMEPIGPVETDSEQCVVQMRSVPPQRGDDGTTYYELLVRRGGELSLARYRNQPGAGRSRIEAVLTREVLARLVDDFVAVV